MGGVDALGWAGSALLVYSLLQAQVLRFPGAQPGRGTGARRLQLLLGIWPTVAMNAVLAGINVWFLRKLLTERHDDTAY